MARVQLIVPNQDRDRYVHQARSEGLTLSAWLRAAAQDRLEKQQRSKRFKSIEELNQFFAECDQLVGPGTEPDWEEHLAVINESRGRGAAPT